LCLTVCFSANAQTSVSYGYDASGNRISRTIHMKMLTPPPQDSTESPIPDEPIPDFPIVAAEDDAENEKNAPAEVYTDALAGTQIAIYPNPTTGQLHIKTSDIRYPISDISIFDMLGKRVASVETLRATSLQPQPATTLDISHLPAGTYIMRITIGEETTSWKIIKSER
jgi:hypothetical protein